MRVKIETKGEITNIWLDGKRLDGVEKIEWEGARAGRPLSPVVITFLPGSLDIDLDEVEVLSREAGDLSELYLGSGMNIWDEEDEDD